MKFTVLKHTDVRGKELMYLKLENEGKEVLINIGVKSYEAILELTGGYKKAIGREDKAQKIA